MGGRRGDAGIRTPTEGLLYATARHATSRAGEPCPHDHVLGANLVRMDAAKGGWKGADSALWRQHMHAATVVGRMASAHRAVELGYAIVRDDGPSGKLGHRAIAGVPEVVMSAHSNRAAEIEAETDRTGYSSYRARGIAARTTRAPKRHKSVGDLLPRWVAEMGEDGLERPCPHPGHRPGGGRAPPAGAQAAGRGDASGRQPGRRPRWPPPRRSTAVTLPSWHVSSTGPWPIPASWARSGRAAASRRSCAASAGRSTCSPRTSGRSTPASGRPWPSCARAMSRGAVSWYAGAGRIAVSPVPGHLPGRHRGRLGRRRDQRHTAGDARLRRANVAELNRRGRLAWERLGRLSGKELVVGEVGGIGHCYRVSDTARFAT